MSDIGSEPGSAAENHELGSAVDNHQSGPVSEPEAAAEQHDSAVEDHEPGSAAEPEAAAEHHELDQDERAELERLRAETAEAHVHEGDAGQAPRRRHSWRTPVSIVLIVLGCILSVVAVIGVWAGEEISNTDRYVATVEPLIHDRAIQDYLTDEITNQITSRLNVTGVVNQAASQLNSRGLTRISSLLQQFGPQIASSVTSFVHSTVHSVITSSAVATIWVQVNTIAHRSIVQVLSGQGSGAVSTRNGQIVLNLGPIITVVKQDLVAHGFKLASNIPPVSPTLALFQTKDLGKAQALYRLVTTLRWVLPILALLILAAGVWVARNRRRALIGAGLGVAASMLILGLGLNIAHGIYLSSIPSTFPTDAAASAYDALVHFLRESLRVVLLVGLVVAIGAFFIGPSRAAVRARSSFTSGVDWIRHYGERRGVSTGPVGQWTYLHRRTLRIGAVALFALIFVFWGEPTVLVVIVLIICLLVVLGLIELIGRPIAEPAAAKEPEVASHT